jgi:hypothetical protein
MANFLKHRKAQSGVALVITLIMLSVITIIAVAFLLLSQRERSSVSSTMVATDAELVLNAGMERAKTELMADMTAYFLGNPTNRTFTNAQGQWTVRRYLGPDLMVSTTFTNSTNSYVSSTPSPLPNQAPFIASLHYDPRVPVWANRPDRPRDGWTNMNVFYIDLNRNGIFDESGFVQVRDGRGAPIAGQTNYVVGDPEWVGLPARLDEVHSGTNRFIGRYAYLIAPAGRTLNVNFLHNHAKPTGMAQDGFYRNQGHGSWEINLAAFLADLNADQWNVFPYGFNLSLNVPSGGTAFQDANDLLKYRYDYPNSPAALRSAQTVFGTYAQAFRVDGIDEYADGITGVVEDDETKPWPGAPNPHQFFSIHDFFNAKNPSIANFQAKLFNAGFSNDTYNAHTFYRMLAQLGTDSVPEKMRVTWDNQGRPNDDARINLNYANTNEVGAAEFKRWTAPTFLQVAGDRLLAEYGYAIDANTRLSVTNLPVYKVVGSRVTNYYTPDVHRILQMTLNIYDAMTNSYYPTVLKPRLANVNGDVVIVGYDEMLNSGNITNAINWIDLNDPAQRANPQTKFAYGVPVLIGAKKGFPNFNEAAFQNDVQFERKLQVVKTQSQPAQAGGQGTVRLTRTNQIFFIGVSNSFAMEAWNSYSNAYPGRLLVYSAVDTTVCITNDDGMAPWITNSTVASGMLVQPPNVWQGGQFKIPDPTRTSGLWTNQVALDYKVYFNKGFYPSNEVQWSEAKYPAVQWGVSTTNHIRFFIVDRDADRIIDAVGLAPLGLSTNMTQAVTNDARYAVFWDTTQAGNVTTGVRDQLLVSQGKYLAVPRFRLAEWDRWGYFDQRAGGVSGFTNFLSAVTPSNIMVAPFTPQVKAYRRVMWRANDPLVHYVDADLRYDLRVETKGSHVSITRSPERGEYALEFGKTNFAVVWTKANEYSPWDPPPDGDASKIMRHANLHIMDPNIRSSNDWDFPTNSSGSGDIKFGSIGWLGRVHRGTPWQTVYMKPWFPTNEWGLVHYSMRAHPTNDWRLADIFTVAQHPNASRGLLSVNQTNVAAWSAVLGGIDVTRLTANGKARTNIEPAAIGDTNVQWIVEGINARRESLPGKIFNNLEEFLSVPELTTRSPFLMPSPAPANDPLTDDDYERIPRGMLSLVKPGERRFVIYAFGQSLKPAPQSVISGGTYRGLCLNYEVTGEMAARAVVRIDLEYPQPPQPGPPRPRAVVESFNILPPE